MSVFSNAIFKHLKPVGQQEGHPDSKQRISNPQTLLLQMA